MKIRFNFSFQIIPGSIQRSSKRHDASSRMRPASDPINLPFDYVKNVVGSQTVRKSHSRYIFPIWAPLRISGVEGYTAISFTYTFLI